MAVAGYLLYKTELDTDSIKKSGSTVKSIIAGLGITKMITKAVSTISNSIDDAVKRVDVLNNFPKVMSNLGISADKADKSIKKMSDKLTGLPTTLDQGAMAVQRFTSKNGDVEKSTDIFLALNNAILAGGASTEIQANALEQMSQSFAKGKMDMMEWRAIQTAMPAQLKQVAEAMGVTTSELGEMLREGKNTDEVMDQFMDTIIKLNKKGVKGFQSFEKQARNSTAGIGTSITVAKTQVVKGMASIIDGLNKGLKKAKLGSVSDIIAKIGKKAKEVLDKIGTALSKIPFDTVLNVLKKLLPIILNITTAWISYHAILKAISILAVAKKIGETAIAFVQLIPCIRNAKDAMDLLMMTFNVNPIVLVITAVVALTTALIAFTSESDNSNKKLEELKQTTKEYDDEMKKINKRKDESLSTSMNEIRGYQSLADELQNIVDENGKVKEGYEERAKIITGELSKALGIEIDLVDGVIQNYKDLQQEISNLIEKKKAEAYINAHQEEYQKALKDEVGLYKNVAEAAKKRNISLDKMTTALDKEIKKDKELGKYKEEIIKFLKSEVTWSDLSYKAREAYNNMSDETIEILNKEEDAYYEHNEELKTASELYAKNEEIIKKNKDATESLTKADQALKEGKKETADEYFKQVGRIYNDTVTFNGKMEKENNDAYEKEKTNRQAYLDFLMEHQDKYSADFIESEKKRIDEELKQLEKERDKSNEEIKKKNKDALDNARIGINDQLNALTDRKYEFRDAGNGNVQLYVDGIASGKPMSTSKANELTTAVIKQLNNGNINAKQAGNFLTQGFASGMTSDLSSIIRAGTTLASRAIQAIRDKAQIQSPSKVTKQLGKYFDEGFEIGIKDGEKDVIKTAGDFSDNVIDKISEKMNIDKVLDDMYKEMNKTIQMENAKLNFDVASNDVYNKSMQLPAIIDLSANFEGTVPVQLNLDGEKIYDNQQKISIRKSVQYGGMK